ncbi:MAG TPA: hypothetical protein VL854_02960 [Nitrososphaeraceae archaeon]|nr:hypothetical protein [Nitrososphaeraceae archaeon]
MKKIYLAIIILAPVVLVAQNLLFNSDGNLFPQQDGVKWLGSESNRFYQVGAKNVTIKGSENGSLKLKTDGDFQNSIEFWADKDLPMFTFGVRPGDSYKLYLSGPGGFGNVNGQFNSDIMTVTTNLYDTDGNSTIQRTIETFGSIFHAGNLAVGGRVNFGSTDPLIIDADDPIQTSISTRVIKSNGGQVTSGAIPTLTPGKRDGDLFWLTGSDATNTLVIQGEDVLNGSLIRFPSGTPSTRTVALYKTFAFRWSEAANVWIMWTETTPPTTGGGGGSGDVTAANPFGVDSKIIVSDGTDKGVKASSVTLDGTGNFIGVNGITTSGSIVSGGPITVPNVAYNASGWDNDLTVPTKDAVRDKIEAIINSGPVTAATNFGTNNILVRSDGTQKGLKATAGITTDDNGQLFNVGSINMKSSSSTIIYPVNTRQAFVPGSINAGINVGTFNGTPSSLVGGDIWHSSSSATIFGAAGPGPFVFAISAKDEINLDLRNFKASGSPAPVFDQTEDADKWIFTDGQTSVIQCQFPIGHSWGSVANVVLMFSTAATTGNVVFALQTMQSFFGNNEAVNGSGYTAPVNLSAAPAPTFAGGLGMATSTLPMDGVTGPGNAVLFRLRIQRRGADAGDTITDDVKLHAVRVDWIRNR